jgi:diadenosine tetraphosphatase ApaH/serine/threonine PP2A family protein phosphatase
LRIAVLSDVHSNRHALDAVLAALPDVDALWFLGDLVGYGPRPNECCEVIAARADVALAGNHDLGVLGKVDIGGFNSDGAAAIRWTRSNLQDETEAFLDGLAPQAVLPDAQLFHASPRDPVWEYVLDEEAARAALEQTTAPLVLIGHSHLPLAISPAEAGVSGGHAPAGTTIELGAGRWLLNPGSVGQPRDGDRRAAYLVLDLDRGAAGFHRVEYDIEATQAEIREAGLPSGLATRLEHGV